MEMKRIEAVQDAMQKFNMVLVCISHVEFLQRSVTNSTL